MGRTVDEIIAQLPIEEQAAIASGDQELKQEVEGLRELRQIAGKAQADIASALHIKQPSVSKIVWQTDRYLSILRNYVEAIGGKLESTVRLSTRPLLRPQSLGEIAAALAMGKPGTHSRTKGGAASKLAAKTS